MFYMKNKQTFLKFVIVSKLVFKHTVLCTFYIFYIGSRKYIFNLNQLNFNFININNFNLLMTLGIITN